MSGMMGRPLLSKLTRLIEELSIYSCASSAHLVQQTLHHLQDLSQDGVSPSPLLTYELLCTLTSNRVTFKVDTKRERPQELRTRHYELSASLKPPLNVPKDRLLTALRVLFFDAPQAEASQTRSSRIVGSQTRSVGALIELERIACTKVSASDDPWVEWRRHAESRLLRSMWYRWHLMCLCLLNDRPFGLSLLDESALKISSITRDQLERLQVKAKVGLGDDDQRFRSAEGSFFEIGFDTLPSDPTRVLASDLSLFASKNEATRAALLMKISDSSLSVRFGEVQRPSRRRARVRVMVILSDLLEHHVYGSVETEGVGRDGSPLVDTLRQAACHLIPHLFNLIKQTEIEGEVYLIRSGVGGAGVHRLGEITTDHQDYLAYRSSKSTVAELMINAPWFFEDYPLGDPQEVASDQSSSDKVMSPPPVGNSEDAVIGIWLGAPPSWLQGYPLYQEVGFKLNDEHAQVSSRAEKSSTHSSPRALNVLKQITRRGRLDPYLVADIILDQLDLSVSEESRNRDMSNPWEGTTL